MFRKVALEIKEEILTKIKGGGKVIDLASQYGVSCKTIYTWLARMVTPEISFSEYNRLRRENDELKRMIGIMALDQALEKLEQKDLLVKQAIDQVHLVHPAYGHKRLALALKYGPKRVLRVMHKFGIKPPRRKAKAHYLTKSDSNHSYTNVDIFTREILGAEISQKHDSHLALSVIKSVVKNNKLTIKDPHQIIPIFHSDQGSEFMAQTVTSFLEQNNIKVSVSDKASSWQNPYQESFFDKFKTEIGDINRFETLGELVEEIVLSLTYTAKELSYIITLKRSVPQGAVTQGYYTSSVDNLVTP